MVNEFRCKTCGATFSSQAELMNHGGMHVQPPAARQVTYKCAACGGTFKSQEELHEHNHVAHGQHV